MIQGLGMPLSGWPAEFVRKLVEMRFHVILFDNRDIGQSQLFDNRPLPNVKIQLLKRKFGIQPRAVYPLSEMARDAEGLLDALHVESAHVVGISMGGMIAQLLAISSPDRVRSLTSIMSTTGNRKLPGAEREVERVILKRPEEPTPDSRFEHQLAIWELIGSPDYPSDETYRREWLQGVFARGMTADGVSRQMLAILSTPDRTDALRRLRMPTLVLHGENDPLVPVECGRATAAAIPDADLVTYPGMGHDLPIELQPDMVQRIAKHVHHSEIMHPKIRLE